MYKCVYHPDVDPNQCGDCYGALRHCIVGGDAFDQYVTAAPGTRSVACQIYPTYTGLNVSARGCNETVIILGRI